jgi:hypothetical protein
MECPKCQTEYEQGDIECKKCGIIFEKYYQRQARQAEPPPIKATNRLISGCKACGNKISLNATSCPNCGEPQNILPEGVKGWSWGACLLNWIWAIGNNTWIGLLSLIPGVGFIMAVVLGYKGREWAWKNKHWDSLEHFNKIQKRWSVVGACLILVPLALGVFFGVFTPQHQAYNQRAQQIAQKLNNPSGQLQAAITDNIVKSVAVMAYQNPWESERADAAARCAKVFADYQMQAVCLQNEKEGHGKMQGNFGFSESEARKAKERCSEVFADFQMQAVCMDNEQEGYGKIYGR